MPTFIVRTQCPACKHEFDAKIDVTPPAEDELPRAIHKSFPPAECPKCKLKFGVRIQTPNPSD